MLGVIWLAGIALGQGLALPSWQWLLIAVLAGGGAVLYRRLLTFRRLYLGLFVGFLAAARSSAALPSSGPGTLAYYNDLPGRPTIVGRIVAYPDVRDAYTGLRVAAESIAFQPGEPARPVRGLLLVRASRFQTWEYGDRIEVSGPLQTPPAYEGFSYRDYLAHQGIHSLMPEADAHRLRARQGNGVLQVIYALRSRVHSTLLRLFPEPEASLLSGILLGIESGIPPEVREAFNRTATTHIIAISGFNVTIVAGLFLGGLARWLGRRRGLTAAAIGILTYTLLVGAQPSVVRAALMAGVALLARWLGRRAHALASLAAAALVMTFMDPLSLRDVAFQLSFAATLGLVLYAEPLERWLFQQVATRLRPRAAAAVTRPIAEFFFFTLAAQVTTLPLTLYYFRQLSLASWLANPAILPAQPALMVLGGAAALLGSVWQPLGLPFAWAAWPFAAYTIRMVEALAHWEWASLPLGPFTPILVVFLYLVLFGLTAWMSVSTDQRRRILPFALPRLPALLPRNAALGSIALVAVLVWSEASARPDGRLHVTILDVGSGDALLIESPGGRFVLINGGPSPVALSEALGRRLPPRDRTLDWLVIAGTRDEQVAGLVGLVERVSIQRALLAGEGGGAPYSRVLEELTENAVPLVEALPGQRLHMGGGSLDVMVVGRHGAALRLTSGRFSMLLAPGADSEVMQLLQQPPLRQTVTALLLPAGGDARLNPHTWIADLRPWVAILSVEAGDRRGRPDTETLDALRGTTLLRTDHHGWITLTTDGQRLWVEVEREPVAPVP